jgi:hypothetical protein
MLPDSVSLAAAPPLSQPDWESARTMSRNNEGTPVPEVETVVSEPARRLATFLRRRHPFKTAIAVEATCGVSEAAVKKLLTRGSMPSFTNLGRLLGAYGPELLAEIMIDPPEWLREAARRSGATEASSRG